MGVTGMAFHLVDRTLGVAVPDRQVSTDGCRERAAGERRRRVARSFDVRSMSWRHGDCRPRSSAVARVAAGSTATRAKRV